MKWKIKEFICNGYSHTNYKIMTELLWDTVKDSKIKLPKAFIIYAGFTITLLVCVWNQHDWLTNRVLLWQVFAINSRSIHV